MVHDVFAPVVVVGKHDVGVNAFVYEILLQFFYVFFHTSPYIAQKRACQFVL